MSDTRTLTLVEFLTARLDEDEMHAKKDIWCAEGATPGDWHALYGYNLPESYIDTDDGVRIARLVNETHEGDAMLVGRFKPSTVRRRAMRVLAEVDAKRRIVAWCGQRDRIYIGTVASNPDAPRAEDFAEGDFTHRADAYVLRLLALPYANRPDYREEWRP